MRRWSARRSISSRSKRSVLPAVTQRQVAPASVMASTVGTPTTGTSKRMSWPGLATLTTVSRPRASVPAPREGARATDGRGRARHRLNRDAGARAHDDGLAEVESRDLARDFESVGDVAALALVGRAACEHALRGQVVLQEVGRVNQLDPLARQLGGDASDERVGVAARQAQKHPEHPHVRHRAAENLHVPDLTRHDRLLHTLALEEANHATELPDADPRQAFGDLLDSRVGLFLDGRDGDLSARAPRALDDAEGKL